MNRNRISNSSFFSWIQRNNLVMLRLSIGLVYFWFGVIKFFPDLMFTKVPYALTMEGQYVIKNLIIIAAGLALWAGAEKQQEKAA